MKKYETTIEFISRHNNELIEIHTKESVQDIYEKLIDKDSLHLIIEEYINGKYECVVIKKENVDIVRKYVPRYPFVFNVSSL